LYRKSKHILCPITLFENRALYEVMWKIIVKRDRPQMTIWRTSITCWIPKAKNTHSEYVILLLRGYANVPQCYVNTYTACLAPYSFPISYLWTSQNSVKVRELTNEGTTQNSSQLSTSLYHSVRRCMNICN